MTPELQALRATLDGLRAGILRKLAGLSEEDARRSTVASGTNPAGLLQHLTFVESWWFAEVVAGGRASGGGKVYDLRWVLLAVIEETARHAGHADIIREQVDGRVGR
jgi:hypothetical protein